MKKYLVGIFVSMFGLTGCNLIPFKSSKAHEFLQDQVQTESFAILRKNQLSNVSYKLNVNVSEPGNFYSGDQTLTFEIAEPKDVYIDFQGGSILATQVNQQVQSLMRGPLYILVPKEMLTKGPNTVQLLFRQEYSRSGAGLHKFTDPEDNKIYLYTDFEPYDANRWAPFFDQPDIKAPLELTVKASARWTIISNTSEVKFEKNGNDGIWTFAKTPPMSTYIYAFVAGPYYKWETKYNDIPLAIYTRDSLNKYVPYQEWFNITKAGLKFYEEYFDVPYPFKKYDQILVPEFNSGAMENIAAVTFSERYLRRKDYTRPDRQGLYNTVLHEMAHMWFGDLVTMKWWNDLWLNESFATYMATLSLSKATEFKDAGINFSVRKQHSFNQDESVTTHPISGEVLNSNQAFTNFDSITYGKGASVMKELSLYLGEDLFRDSLRNYIKKHQFSNTTINDFISAFNETTTQNLKPWFDAWLTTSGVDTIKQSFQCEPNKLTLQVEVAPKGRPHALKMVAFKKHWGELKPIATAVFKTKGSSEAETVIAEVLNDKKIECPDFTYANFEDHSYAKIEIDETSLKFLEENIQLIKSDLLRVSIWTNLWSMVRDQKYKLAQFSGLALKALAHENNQEILIYLTQKTVGSKGSANDSVLYFTANQTAQEKQIFEKLRSAFQEVIRTRLKGAVADRYKIFLEAYLAAAGSQDSLAYITELLAKSTDPDMRWKMLFSLCREAYPRAGELVSSELESDKSEIAYKNSLSCRAANPSKVSKQEYLRQLFTDKITLTSDEVDRIAGGLFPGRQRSNIESYSQEIYRALHEQWPRLEVSYQGDLAYGLAPVYCSEKANLALGDFVNAEANLPATLKKPLLDMLDEDSRCLKIRQFNK